MIPVRVPDEEPGYHREEKQAPDEIAWHVELGAPFYDYLLDLIDEKPMDIFTDPSWFSRTAQCFEAMLHSDLLNTQLREEDKVEWLAQIMIDFGFPEMAEILLWQPLTYQGLKDQGRQHKEKAHQR